MDTQGHRVIAIDSDGCVFDNMTAKHNQCFGPALIDEWNLQSAQVSVQARWNQINLYSSTRGINRFLAILKFWQTVRDDELPSGYHKPNLDRLEHLANHNASLSVQVIEEALSEASDAGLCSALKWHARVNQYVSERATTGECFHQAKSFIQSLADQCHVYVVSSANASTIKHEWDAAGISSQVKDFITQERMSKSDFLSAAKKGGAQDVLMIGDSPGDLYAAQSSDVFFYPILPGDESGSWSAVCEQLKQGGADTLFQSWSSEVHAYQEALGLIG
jgi:soluble P-type ATPase